MKMEIALPAFLAHPVWIAGKIEDVLSMEPEAKQMLNAFPREMVSIASCGLDIPIIGRPNLSIRNAHEFFCALEGRAPENKHFVRDRPLYGLLHLGPPSNVILFSEDISPALANYVVAHEIGHFFADVCLTRHRWLQGLSQYSSEIQRLFAWQTNDEWLELQALVKGLPDRPQPIMERGSSELPETARRERLADLIARELLAPWQVVAPLFLQRGLLKSYSWLKDDFGLPDWVIADYIDDLKQASMLHRDAISRLFDPLM